MRLPAYWKAMAAAECDLTHQVSLRLEVDNLFDERYAQSAYSSLWASRRAPQRKASIRLAL